jgi:hypothetical protein
MSNESGVTDLRVLKVPDSREVRISKGEKVEAIYVPDEGLKVTLGDESLPTAREFHLIMNKHGCEVRLRLHKHEQDIEHAGVGVWTDYMIINPTVYVMVKKKEESDGSTI